MTPLPIPSMKPLKSGNKITDRYIVEGWIGEGGMQDVYLAHDDRFGRKVALKYPKTVSAERRFFRSAKIAAQVNHPNVAKTLDYVEVGESGFLLEEYIVGQDLKDVRTTLPVMDPYAVAHVGYHIARGVAASHHAGVIHRDLKPSNIMVSEGFNLETIKVTDFGIAKMTEEELALIDDETFTSSSTMAGALPYMSPEMLKGAKFGDKPTDVWSIGAMLYELITGQKPFGNGLESVVRIRDAIVPELPAFALKGQFKGIANGLYRIVKKCLVAAPEDRITADELVQEFSALCYPIANRVVATITEIRYGSQFFAHTATERIFFHADSVYGVLPSLHEKVCLVVYQGSPYPRAHPAVRMS